MWRDRKVLVTGGASFIGSHLVDAQVARGAKARVVDNLSCGKLSSLRDHLERDRIEFIEGDLRDLSLARSAMEGIEVVFHLAASVHLAMGVPTEETSHLQQAHLALLHVISSPVERMLSDTTSQSVKKA